MSRETGWHDVHDGMDCPCGRAGGNQDAVLRALAERICPIPDAHTASPDPHRFFGQDLAYLADGELALEAARATFRLCLEAEGPDRWWLLRRLERIRHERACRQGRTPPAAVAAPVGPRGDEEEREREQERRNHEAWLRWNAARTGAAA